jgi:hypothetical protein
MHIARLIKSHPLLLVILAAIVLRLPAVTFSKGYMASDDHFETVMVAYNWLHGGFYSEDGRLLWRGAHPRPINRFPLYTMFLHAIMRVYYSFGITSLDTMMYGVRLAHALLSLITVWMVFRIVGLVTGSVKWSVLAGLLAAGHGLMPYLSVRTLIEVVGGHFLVATFYQLYRYQHADDQKHIYWAGLLSGLAWMIRLQVAAALLPIPLFLWWSERRFRPGFQYCLVVLLMVAVASVTDYFVVGSFGETMFNQLLAGHEELYETIVLMYPVAALVFFIPPFSIMAFWMAATRTMWREHKLLILSILSFMLIHSLMANRQERFMIPIIPLLIVTVMLAIWYHLRAGGFFARRKRLFCAVISVSLVINLALLFVFTANYGHRGLVEPLARLERISPPPGVVYVTPELNQLFPKYYGGFDLPRRFYVFRWSDLDRYAPGEDFQDYFIVYPPAPKDLPRYLDSLTAKVGHPVEQFHIAPSTVDNVLHLINPEHNPSREAWVYRLEGKKPPSADN